MNKNEKNIILAMAQNRAERRRLGRINGGIKISGTTMPIVKNEAKKSS